MEHTYLKNGMKIIYEFRAGDITSFSIGIDAGAIREAENEIGLAHMVEHMVFKETETRSEIEINKASDKIFGFNNAMTNYPYVLYYGTTLSKDFNAGVELFSDILIKPTFPEKGFEEEIQVILEELKEWKEDQYQNCEDELLHNGFKIRRIRKLIIGEEKQIKKYKLDDLKRFYSKYYCPENCCISIVGSVEFQEAFAIAEKYFSAWKENKKIKADTFYENNIAGTFETKENIESCKLQYMFTIHEMNSSEIAALRILNFAFGEGTSSLLYDEIRTKNGFAYEVTSNIKNENGIKFFTIALGTSEKYLKNAIKVVDECIKKMKDREFVSSMFKEEALINFKKMIKLKQALKFEKSLVLANTLASYEIMFQDYNILELEQKELEVVDCELIYEVAIKLFRKPSIQIIKGN